MFISAHLVAGLIVGKITNDYPLAMAFSLFAEVDHAIPFIKHKIIFSPKKLWSAMTDPLDPFDNQRNYLHSFFTLGISSLIIYLIDSRVGTIFFLSYLSHLLLDLLDGSDFYPIYPFKFNYHGPINYYSKGEMVFTLALLALYFLI